MENIIINGVKYEILGKKHFGVFGRYELTLKKLNGKRLYHAVRYEDGSISEAV